MNVRGIRDARFGPSRNADGRVAFRLWAPDVQRVELLIGEHEHDMHRDSDGWFEVTAPVVIATTGAVVSSAS